MQGLILYFFNIVGEQFVYMFYELNGICLIYIWCILFVDECVGQINGWFLVG